MDRVSVYCSLFAVKGRTACFGKRRKEQYEHEIGFLHRIGYR